MSTSIENIKKIDWLSPSEERAWRALQFMHMRLDAQLARQLAVESQLSYPDYLVLVALTDRDDNRMRLFELAEVLGWEKSRASHQVARMADRGLVKKEKCDSDRRGAFIVTTALGKRTLTDAAPGHVAAVRRLFMDVLSAEQLEAIGDAAEHVLSALEAEPNYPSD